MPEVQHTKAAQQSAAALVRLTRKAASDLRDDAEAEVNEAAASLAGRKDTKPRQAFAVVIATAGKLGLAVTAGLALTQANATTIAHKRLAAELRQAGLVLQPHDLPTAKELFASPSDPWVTVASDSIVAQWQGQALTRVNQAIRQGRDLGRALAESKRALAPSVERAAITETARAYNDTHRQALIELVQRSDRVALWVEEARVERMWCALADACDDCESLDGETTGIDDSFRGGAEPPLHPHCHCNAVIVSNVTRKAR